MRGVCLRGKARGNPNMVIIALIRLVCALRPKSFNSLSRPFTAARVPSLLQATFISMWFILIMIDFMFLDDKYFIFEPDIKVRSTTSHHLPGLGG